MAAKSSNIARRAKRVAMVAQAEADNSEDPEYVQKLNAAAQDLEQSTWCSKVGQQGEWYKVVR